MNERLATGLFSASILGGDRPPSSEHAKAAAAAAAVAQAHLNGTSEYISFDVVAPKSRQTPIITRYLTLCYNLFDQ